jgi:hypothetical protein
VTSAEFEMAKLPDIVIFSATFCHFPIGGQTSQNKKIGLTSFDQL